MRSSSEKIIPALDVQNSDELDFLIKELSGNALYVKIGMELYYTYGNEVIKKLKANGFKIFLDLKIHDIPTTAFRTCMTLAKNKVDILNVHASGGLDMMKASMEGFKGTSPNSLLIGVTQLTSTNQNMLNNQLKVKGNILDITLEYASLVKQAGLDGVVCSPHDVEKIKQNLGQKFICITPGIRPLNSQSDDQKRIMTPKDAIKNGSDYLVIGRAITRSKSPRESFNQIVKGIINE